MPHRPSENQGSSVTTTSYNVEGKWSKQQITSHNAFREHWVCRVMDIWGWTDTLLDSPGERQHTDVFQQEQNRAVILSHNVVPVSSLLQWGNKLPQPFCWQFISSSGPAQPSPLAPTQDEEQQPAGSLSPHCAGGGDEASPGI